MSTLLYSKARPFLLDYALALVALVGNMDGFQEGAHMSNIPCCFICMGWRLLSSYKKDEDGVMLLFPMAKVTAWLTLSET